MWLLEAAIRQEMEWAQKSGVSPSAEMQAQFEARIGNDDSTSGARLLTIAGDSAEIDIKGVLTKAPSFMAMLFGGGNVTYPEIISAIAIAEQDDAVEKITLAIDSPGGHVDGLFDAIDAIKAAKKPTKTIFTNTGASAAFALGVQSDEVLAANISTRLGSVGVVVGFHVDESAIDITSTDAPRKRPDVTTDAGVAMVREELDAIHEIFVDAIADGRDTTPNDVNSNFGKGGVFLSGEALKRGMIDGVINPGKSAKTTTAKRGNKTEASHMDLKTLQAHHPETFAAVKEMGIIEGTAAERDRVTAHLTMGEKTGAMKTASAAITDGSGMTMALTATYMTAGMDLRDVSNRADDDANANAGDGANNDDGEGTTQADDVCDILAAKLGIVGEL